MSNLLILVIGRLIGSPQPIGSVILLSKMYCCTNVAWLIIFNCGYCVEYVSSLCISTTRIDIKLFKYSTMPINSKEKDLNQ